MEDVFRFMLTVFSGLLKRPLVPSMYFCLKTGISCC